jgi:glycosyltransferase involved in cell wall biosynthesis
MPVLDTFGAPRLSVVCPFFNEEAIIVAATERMLGNLRSKLSGTSWELILVDDGSRDRSLALLKEYLVATDAREVRVLSYDRNAGRGRALKTGIDAALGDIIVTTEVDCSWGDDIVRSLVAELDAHPEADFVVASPHLPGGGLVNVDRHRVLLTKLGNRIIRTFFFPQVTMNTGMTRAYRAPIIKPLVAHENGKEFHLEVLLKLLTLGFAVREIPATITWQDHKLTRPRKSSTRVLPVIDSHLRFIAIARPVRYFAWLALACLLVGLGFEAAAVWMLLTSGVAAFLAIVGLIVLLFCLLFVGFSVLFFQMRETMRESWMSSYPLPHPPTVPKYETVYPVRSERRHEDTRRIRP